MSIFNSNDFKRGFKDGKNDAQKGEDKSYIKSGFSLKFALHGENAINTYIEGYNAGYLEGLKKDIPQKVEIINKGTKQEQPVTKLKTNTNNIINSNLKNYNNMDLQRIELQLEALYQLKAFLIEFEAELKEKHNQYNDKVLALRENGLPDEIYVNYDQNYCIPTGQKIYQITEAMQNRDLPYIQKQIEVFEQARENANINY